MKITIDTAVDDKAAAERAVAVIAWVYDLDGVASMRESRARVIPTEDAPDAGQPDPAAVFAPPALAAAAYGPGHPVQPDPYTAYAASVATASDPAAVFGAAGNGAPSGVVAAVSPTAPGALPVFSPPTTPGMTPSVPAGPATVAQPGPVAQAGGSAPAVELDTEGLPWDERIHASTKSKVENGNWRAKKGLNDAAFVAKVKAELRARVAVGMSAAMPPPATGAAVPFVPPVAPSLPAQPAVPSVPVGPPTTFEQLMPRITAACTAGVVPMDALSAACAAHKLPSITSLQQYPDFVGHVWRYLQAQYPALQ